MKIKELLSDESKWTRQTMAKDKYGRGVFSIPGDRVIDVDDEVCWCLLGAINGFNGEGPAPATADEVCWCLLGAINRCYNENEREVIFGKIKEKIQISNIWEWNDDPKRKFEEVKALVEELDI